MEQQTKMDNHTPYLPQDIVANILVRLPVKSLIRFQCVCKDWKNLFKTQSFIAEHLHHSTQQNPFLLVDCISISARNNHWHLCLLNREMQVLELPKPSFIGGSCRIYSSNGLLCVELIISKSFFLWNPANREVRQVPEALQPFQGLNCCVGFGFTPIVNDYKIVRLLVFLHRLVQRVEVYSLSTGSWKEIDVGNLVGLTNITHDGFTYNGAVYWFGLEKGMEGKSDIYLIVSFDITMEVFTLIDMPTSAIKSLYCNRLTVYENKLAMLSRRGGGDFKSSWINLWVMEGLGWTKICTINPYPFCAIWRNEIICKVYGIFGPFPKTEGGELMGDDNRNIKTITCNLMTNEFKILSISRCCIGYSISNYVESLVPVGNIHMEEP